VSIVSITIRDAADGDIEVLVALNDIVQRLHVAALPAYFKQPEPGSVQELFRSKLQRPDVRVWIASADGILAGYLVAIFRERPENPLCFARTICEIDEIAVAPTHRRTGLARALVDRVRDVARARGVRDVELNSWSFNDDAHAAFVALGFRPKSVRFGCES
jgi:GNAT superfamily N-acetyltransferase